MSAFVSTKHIPAPQRISPEYAAFFPLLSSSFCDSHKSLIRSSSPSLFSPSFKFLPLRSKGMRRRYRMQLFFSIVKLRTLPGFFFFFTPFVVERVLICLQHYDNKLNCDVRAPYVFICALAVHRRQNLYKNIKFKVQSFFILLYLSPLSVVYWWKWIGLQVILIDSIKNGRHPQVSEWSSECVGSGHRHLGSLASSASWLI